MNELTKALAGQPEPNNIGDRVIWQAMSFIRIIANETTIPLETFGWHDKDKEGGWIRLNEISKKLLELEYGNDASNYYVWNETPSKGTIYKYDPYSNWWVEYGSTFGYA
ncbi:hypothetical protein [Alicyclobacillus mengziensis]|uniref:Uncharacterized protein n=1 Tax=Alicyclobacillus mengziensis TaxID=2931921 RepID=A0A9X7W482_9BACL|nr:hypothetical protein [Alicyclobacillus mengziensis]QSO50129.1 hypothetical protein JZ786_24495 [Alicyclobacillus mengziensis]